MKLDELKPGFQKVLGDEAQNKGCLDMLADLGFIPKKETIDQGEVKKIKAEAKNEGIREGKEAEAARVKGILNACNLTGTLDMAANLIESGASVEDAGQKIIEARATADGNVTTVTSTVGPLPKDNNPLMTDAVKRSEQAKS